MGQWFNSINWLQNELGHHLILSYQLIGFYQGLWLLSYVINFLVFIRGYGSGVWFKEYSSESMVLGVYTLQITNGCQCMHVFVVDLPSSTPKAKQEVSRVRYWKVSLCSLLRCFVALCWCRWRWLGMWTLYTSTFIEYIKSMTLF